MLHPDTAAFIWSYTRDRTLCSCPRKYYLTYYAAPRARRRSPAPADRQAFRLSRLLTLDLVLGQALHEQASRIAAAIRDGRDEPSQEEVHAKVRGRLNAIWMQSASLDAFYRDPERHPVLLPFYYGRGISEAHIAAIREKRAQCVDHLCSWSGWSTVRQAPKATVRLFERPVRGEIDGLPVWIMPDLVYLCPDACEVVDWKTGAIPECAPLQVATYVLALRSLPGTTCAGRAWRSRIVSLSTAEEQVTELTEATFDEARAFVHASYAEMARYDAPTGVGGTVGAHEFPLTQRRAQCSRCPFWEVCEEELWRRPAARPRAGA